MMYVRNLLAVVFIAAAIIGAARAQGASTQLTIIFNSPPSTSVTCTALGPFSVPTAAGTNVGNCTVAPAGWQGAVSLSGPQAAQFTAVATSPTQWNINVGASPISSPGSDTLTVTAVP